MTFKGTNPFYHEHVLCHDPSKWFVHNLSDGINQVDLYQLVVFFALCGLYCLCLTLLDYWLVSLHALAINSWRGCTLSGGASDQIKRDNPFSNSWFLILWPLHDASWQLLTVAIADLSSFTLTLWRLYPLRGSLEWDLRVIRPFTMSSLILLTLMDWFDLFCFDHWLFLDVLGHLMPWT